MTFRDPKIAPKPPNLIFNFLFFQPTISPVSFPSGLPCYVTPTTFILDACAGVGINLNKDSSTEPARGPLPPYMRRRGTHWLPGREVDSLCIMRRYQRNHCKHWLIWAQGSQYTVIEGILRRQTTPGAWLPPMWGEMLASALFCPNSNIVIRTARSL